MSKEIIIKEYIIYKLKSTSRKGIKRLLKALFLLLGVLLFISVLEERWEIMDDGSIGIALRMVGRIVSFIFGWLLGGFVIWLLKKWRMLKKVKYDRYVYQFETCTEAEVENGIYHVITDAGTNLYVGQKVETGACLLVVGIEDYGKTYSLLKDTEFICWLQEPDIDNAGMKKPEIFSEQKVTAKKLILEQFRIKNSAFVAPVICFFIGFFVVFYAGRIVDTLPGYLLRIGGCLIEVLSIFVFVHKYLKKMLVDKKVAMLYTDRFTYRIECCIESMRILDRYDRIMYKVQTEYGKEYEFTEEVFVGDEILIVDIDGFEEMMLPLRKGKIRYNII